MGGGIAPQDQSPYPLTSTAPCTVPLPATCGRTANVPAPFAPRGIVKTPERVFSMERRSFPLEPQLPGEV